jgi:hypothetical protein
MGTPYAVEQFVVNSLANEAWRIEDRDRLWAIGESGASSMNLFNYLSGRGYQGSYDSVNNWRDARFGTGSLATEMNAMARQARGLSASDTLNLIAIWMVRVASRLYEELNKRGDIEQLSTKDLLFLLSLNASKIQSAIAEADKIKALADNRDLILGVLEETRLAARQAYGEESPESVPIVENVLAMVREKLDVGSM